MDSTVSFLERVSDHCNDEIYEFDERHLRFSQKRQVYKLTPQEFYRLYIDKKQPTFHHFVAISKHHVRSVKIQKYRRFELGSTCKQIRTGLESAVIRGEKDLTLQRKRDRVYLKTAKRMEYQKRRDWAHLQLNWYCSAMIHDAARSLFGLSHFTTMSKTVEVKFDEAQVDWLY